MEQDKLGEIYEQYVLIQEFGKPPQPGQEAYPIMRRRLYDQMNSLVSFMIKNGISKEDVIKEFSSIIKNF